jgi:hypothetical protein
MSPHTHWPAFPTPRSSRLEGRSGGCHLTASTHSGPVFGCFQRNFNTWDGFGVNEANTNSRSDTGPVVLWEMTGGEILNSVIVGITTNFSDNHCGIRLEDATDALVRNNLITDVDDTQHGENQAGVMAYYSSNATIELNTIHSGVNGIFIKGDNEGPVYVRRNLIHSQDRGIYVAGIDATGGASTGMYVSENIIYNVAMGIVFVSYDAFSPNHAYICNNTVRATDNLLDAPLRFAGENVTGVLNTRIVGNIFMDGYNNIEGTDQNGANFATKAGPDPSDLEIEHNVYFSASNQFSRVGGTNRDFATWKTFTGTDAASPASVESDPLFVDASTHDYRLQSGSPARLAVPDVCDIDGDSNTSETKDAGARQFADNGSPIQIGYDAAGGEDPPPAGDGETRRSPRWRRRAD